VGREARMAQQLWYDIVPHENGWAIVITPDRIESFRTKKAAFDAGVEYARKLRFVGYAVQVRMQHRREGAPAASQKKAS
jgi:hypothetical protein